MPGPVRPAPGDLRRLHRVRPGARASSRTSSATRCCRATPTRTPSPAAPACRPPGCARTRARSSATRSAATTTTVVIFAGSGCDRRDRQADRHPRPAASRPSSTTATTSARRIPADQRPVVFIGPFEHHSNELPWRESIADVVVIPQDADGHIDAAAAGARAGPLRRPAAQDRLVLGRQQRHRHRQRHPRASRRCCTRHGALSFWDFAAAAPYVEHRDVRRPRRDPLAYKDAIFLSPHKFIGGPGTPGRARRPARAAHQPGAGRARRRHGRVRQPDRAPLPRPTRSHREEGGTPAIVESIRAGLVFQLKEAVGVDVIRAHEEHFLRRAVDGVAGRARPSRSSATSTPSGCRSSRSSSAAPSGRYLHHNFVVALLNDLFGIQSRGGCSCAGPYGHRLLGIDLERSHEFEREIAARLRGDQARLGAGQLQLLHLRDGLRRTSSRRCGWSPRRLAAAAGLPVRPG